MPTSSNDRHRSTIAGSKRGIAVQEHKTTIRRRRANRKVARENRLVIVTIFSIPPGGLSSLLLFFTVPISS